MSDYATGLSTLVAVWLGPDGKVYAAQLGKSGFLLGSSVIDRLEG